MDERKNTREKGSVIKKNIFWGTGVVEKNFHEFFGVKNRVYQLELNVYLQWFKRYTSCMGWNNRIEDLPNMRLPRS